jgi:hypothetical protein
MDKGSPVAARCDTKKRNNHSRCAAGQSLGAHGHWSEGPAARQRGHDEPRADGAQRVKLPAGARRLARRTIGIGRAEPISPTALHVLASRDDVVVIGVGILGAGAIDPRLPGEQRTASLASLPSVVADLPRERAIVLHCG